MPKEPIENLLILQDRDRVRVDLEKRLESIPREIEAIRGKIAGQEEDARRAKEELHRLENRRKALEGELEERNRQIVRYKNQQLEVKKNEEYRALTHQIEQEKEKIAALEDEELRILYEIDEATRAAEGEQKRCREEIAAYEARARKLEERGEHTRGELEEARLRVEEARQKVGREYLDVYDRLSKAVVLPVVVPLRDKKCQGCHLRVSSGLGGDARSGEGIATCDNCGRILYWEG